MSERDKHILFVEMATGRGGSTRCLESLIDMCRDAGYRVSVALGYPAEEIERKVDPERVLRWYKGRALRNGLRLRDWCQSSRRWQATAGFAVRGVSSDLPLVLGLARYIRRQRVDLVHANNELLVNRVAIAAARLTGVPVISHQRGWAYPSRLTRLLAGWTDRMIAISDYVAGTLADAGVPPDRVVRIYDGVDCSRYAGGGVERDAVRAKLGVADDDLVIGLPAVLLPWKGHRMFLEAFAQVAAQHPRAKALLVGESPANVPDLRPDIERWAEELGVRDRLLLAGHVEAMAGVYAAMDVAVHASQRPEPFGLVVVEAMAAGRPVVAADAGGPAEIIRHRQDGWLYAMGDRRALAKALDHLLRNADIRQTMSGRATERAYQFDLASNKEGMLDTLRGLLEADADLSGIPRCRSDPNSCPAAKPI